MTTLKDFIEQSLSEIAEGIYGFEQTSEKATVVPQIDNYPDVAQSFQSDWFVNLGYVGKNSQELRVGSVIEFDIAVTVDETASMEAGGKAKLNVLGIGANASAKAVSEDGKASEQRIRFAVPLEFTKKSIVQNG